MKDCYGLTAKRYSAITNIHDGKIFLEDGGSVNTTDISNNRIGDTGDIFIESYNCNTDNIDYHIVTKENFEKFYIDAEVVDKLKGR